MIEEGGLNDHTSNDKDGYDDSENEGIICIINFKI